MNDQFHMLEFSYKISAWKLTKPAFWNGAQEKVKTLDKDAHSVMLYNIKKKNFKARPPDSSFVALPEYFNDAAYCWKNISGTKW